MTDPTGHERTAALADDLRYVLNYRGPGHAHDRPGVWDTSGKPCGHCARLAVARQNLAAYDADPNAVLSVLPAPVDRVTLLREAADICDEAGAVYGSRGANDAAGAAFALMERFQRKANEAEYVATPCDSMNPCEDRGEPCSTHERLMAHGEGDHELCAPDCGVHPVVLPAAVDRAAVLRDFLWRLEQSAGDAAAEKFLDDNPELRRMAAETPGEAEPWLSDSARIGRALIWSWTDIGKGAFGEGYRAAQAEARALLGGQRGTDATPPAVGTPQPNEEA